MDQMIGPMERIFGLSGVGGNSRMTDEEALTYDALIQARINDAVDYEESYVARFREENQKYYYGLEPALYNPNEYLNDEDRPNKSNFVSTDVRDTIMTMMPSLIRIFTSNEEKIVEFVPHTAEGQEVADMMCDYANHVFYNENEGFLMLYGVIKDALTVKGGITTWWTDNDYEVMEQEFENIHVSQYQALMEEVPDVEVVELNMENGSDFIDNITIRYAKSKPLHRVCSVPPDEFRISRDAKTVKTAALVGWERMETVSNLVKRGYDIEQLRDNISSMTVLSDERYLRNPGLVDDDPFGDGVIFGEWYIRIDGDGDGVDELRYICTIGTARLVVADMPAVAPKFALWSSDPRPHTAVGDCTADHVKDIQDLKSQLMRGSIDSLADSINPRMVINELTTNIEDAMNEDIAAIIRVRGNPRDNVDFVKQPYAGGEIQPVVDYLDQVRASRTGVTEASKGLDPAAMQSTALTGINAIVSGAQERIELVARLLAETGLKPTFMGIVQEAVDNPNALRQIKLRGKFVEVNPSTFDVSYLLEVNPTLGKGSDMTRLQALMDVRNTQIMVMEKFGVSNPLVTPVEFSNTLQDMLAIVNIKNSERYFKKIDETTMEQIAAAPKEPDPTTLLAQAELEKVKKDIVVATDKSRQADENLQLQAEKARMDDDFRRDKLSVDAAVRVLDITMDPDPQIVTEGSPAMQPAVENRNQPG